MACCKWVVLTGTFLRVSLWEPETVGSFGDSYIQLLFALMNRWLEKTQTFSVLTICDVNLSSHACDNSMIVGLICIYITFHLLLGKKSLVHGQMRHQVFPSTEIPPWPGKNFRYVLLSIIIDHKVPLISFSSYWTQSSSRHIYWIWQTAALIVSPRYC